MLPEGTSITGYYDGGLEPFRDHFKRDAKDLMGVAPRRGSWRSGTCPPGGERGLFAQAAKQRVCLDRDAVLRNLEHVRLPVKSTVCGGLSLAGIEDGD